MTIPPTYHLLGVAAALALSLPSFSQDESADARRESLQSLGLSDGRTSELLSQAEKLAEAGVEWPQGIVGQLSGSEGIAKVRSFLNDHGFLEEDLAWLDELQTDDRAATVLLHARMLLREGPPDNVDQWPKWNEGDTPGEPDEEQRTERLIAFVREAPDDPRKALEAAAPRNPVYRQLQAEYLKMGQEMDKLREEFIEIPPIENGDVVKPGESYTGAAILERRLLEEGYLNENVGEADVFSERLSKAVENFQLRHNRAIDGILGPDTLAELNRGPEMKREVIRFNLHRARLLPDEPGEDYVIVNIPSSRVFAFSGSGSPELQMKTIVGSQVVDQQTPVFRDVMETVEFSPYWNVPLSIAKDEIVPQARGDHGYLARNNFEIVSSYGAGDSHPVNAGTLSQVEQGDLLIHQTPGPENALGRVKFLFPNQYAIYLHDTPEDQLFEEGQRDFSHGCIRVERPADMAEFFLGPQGWDLERIEEALTDGENEVVGVERRIPVYIVYMTAFPTWRGDRGVEVLPDIYDRDEGLLKKDGEE